ncbi:MAG: alpha/beta hydrolase [Frankiaceae bacterium]|nr:alpha/beta hydrolase [Frankiaceae bacterium]
MHRPRPVVMVGLALLVASCGGGSSAPSGSASATSVSAPSSAAGRPISFTATDGVRLAGKLYGSGGTAVVLSNMGDNDSARWEGFAPQLADRGYLVLTYSYRYPMNSSDFSGAIANSTVADLRGAVAHVRAAGATRLVLIGASLGGMATAKAAAVERSAAEVVLSAPLDLDDYGFHVTRAELGTTQPKLFLGSTNDTTVPFAHTEQMHALAAQPKELHGYADTAHGLHLLDGEHAADLTKRLIDFLLAKAPPTP